MSFFGQMSKMMNRNRAKILKVEMKLLKMSEKSRMMFEMKNKVQRMTTFEKILEKTEKMNQVRTEMMNHMIIEIILIEIITENLVIFSHDLSKYFKNCDLSQKKNS